MYKSYGISTALVFLPHFITSKHEGHSITLASCNNYATSKQGSPHGNYADADTLIPSLNDPNEGDKRSMMTGFVLRRAVIEKDNENVAD